MILLGVRSKREEDERCQGKNDRKREKKNGGVVKKVRLKG